MSRWRSRHAQLRYREELAYFGRLLPGADILLSAPDELMPTHPLLDSSIGL